MRIGWRHPGIVFSWLAGSTLLTCMLLLSGATDSSEKQAPDQPINFPHSVHVGERQIACAYCHRTAETAAYAGMPSTQLCMSCHRSIIPDHPEIWKLRSYWELQEGIPWRRVNRLPAHVYFSHEAHTVTGEMPCSVCHGPVETMDRVYQTAPLTMTWCVDCHQEQSASTECWICHR